MAVQPTICGTVTIGSSDIAHITSWRFAKSGNVQTYTSSSGAGHQLTLSGHISGEVSFDCLYDAADPIYARMKVNDQVTLILDLDGTRTYSSVPVRISDMDDEINVADGSPPTVSAPTRCCPAGRSGR